MFRGSVSFILLALTNTIQSLPAKEFYKSHLTNKHYKILVLYPEFYFSSRVNTTENLTEHIELFYQPFISTDHFEQFMMNNSIDMIITDNDFVSCKKNELTWKYYQRRNIDIQHCGYLQSKNELRSLLSNFQDINQVSSMMLYNDDRLIHNIERVKFDDFIVKPACGAGSGGVFHLYRDNGTLNNLDRFIELRNDNIYISVCNKFIVEEFIGGSEHNLDIVMFKGEVYFWHISDDDIDMLNFQDTGTNFPTKLKLKQRLEMFRQAKRILEHLNIRNGVYHFEFKMYKNKAYLIELNPRRPGGNYVDYIERLYKSNLEFDEILIAFGKEPYYNKKAIKMMKPKKTICEKELFAHSLDANARGVILLNNSEYRQELDKDHRLNYTFNIEDYELLNNTNEQDYAIINIHMLDKKRTCRFPVDLTGIKFVPIYPLNTSKIDLSEVYIILNNTVQTVRTLTDDTIIDISETLTTSTRSYLYSNCPNTNDTCLYIPNLNI